MSDTNVRKPYPPSPYRRGADNGFYFGIYLTGMFFAFVLSVKISLFSLITMAMFVAVPFLIYRWLRIAFVEDGGKSAISSLWMQGIMIFACGSAIAGVVATVYLKWINPDFIIDRLHETIDLYESLEWPQGKEMADVLQRMIDYRIVPSAIQIVVEMIWLSIFSGSLLSLLMSLLARAKSVKQSTDTPNS
ncbi:MAG: DUF4199 domain-containing protein [Paramuribaculum sp.]|nr:DUF4199 domain-containing protein [Paramuribaculum sp.]